MTRPKFNFAVRGPIFAAAISLVLATTVALAQRAPSVRGSLDAVTVLPTTAPATPPTTNPAALPSGHPQVAPNAEDAGSSSVIPGHPNLNQAPTSGALRVVVTQGTPGAAAVGNDPVKVELFSQGNILKTYHAAIGEGGVVELHDLPLDVPFQPVITVTHGGAEEQLVGAVMHKYQPAVELAMKVYEPTTEKPAWTIGLRNISAVPVNTKDGVALQIVDMIGGFNPLDKAWTGENIGSEKRIFTIPLPDNAENVQFGQGMAEAGAKVVDHTAIRGGVMLPGPSQYILGYLISAKDGKATLSFTSPANTTLFALYVPNDTKVGKTTGLELGTAGGANASQARQLLKAKTVKAGETLTVELSNIKVPAPVETKPAEPVDTTTDLNLPVPTPKAKP